LALLREGFESLRAEIVEVKKLTSHIPAIRTHAAMNEKKPPEATPQKLFTGLRSSSELKTPGPALLGKPRLSAVLERGPGALFIPWEIDCHAADCFGMASLLADGAARTDPGAYQAA